MDNQNVLDLFGQNVFNDSTMRKYLSRDKYIRIKKVIDNNLEFDEELAKKLAEAMKTWAIDQGAKFDSSNMFINLLASSSIAWQDFNKGCFLSKDSPLWETKIVGIHNTLLVLYSLINAGDV